MLLAFHKPYGVLSQFTPEPGSKWRPLADFRLPAGVYALGRLDADSEGLLLLSDEPGLNSRLLDPRHAHRREYWAQVEGAPSADTLARLARGGIAIDDYRTLPCRARLLDPAPAIALARASASPTAPAVSQELGDPIVPAAVGRGPRRRASTSGGGGSLLRRRRSE